MEYAIMDPSSVPADYMVKYASVIEAIGYSVLRNNNSTITKDELIQAGRIGLWNAAKNYDSDKGASFSTYCRKKILGYMLDEIRDSGWFSRSVGLYNIDYIEDDTNQDNYRYDRLPEDIIDEDNKMERLERAIDALPDRERNIFNMYLRGDFKMQEIGSLIGVNESRISQLLKQITEKLEKECSGRLDRYV